MKTLPLFYYPSTYVLLDDDKLFLESMAIFLKNRCRLKYFSSPLEGINFFSNHKASLSLEIFLKTNKKDEEHDLPSKNLIDFDIALIKELSIHQERYDEITVMLIDYTMAEMDGLSFAGSIQKENIQKILLTGNTKNNQAIEGFNNNLIQKFIQKGQENTNKKILAYLKELSLDYFIKLSTPLLSCLEAENKLPLSDPIFIDFFEDYCEKYQIEEYYLIDKQGSFFCIDADKKTSYLMIQTPRSIEQFLSIYEGNYLSPELCKSIKEETLLPFFYLKQAYELPPLEWKTYFHPPSILEGRTKYFWTRVEV